MLPRGSGGLGRGRCRMGGCEQGGTVDVGPGWAVPDVQAAVGGEGEQEPTLGEDGPRAGGLWMMLLSTVVCAWGCGPAMPALPRVDLPDPLRSCPRPDTGKQCRWGLISH